MKILAINGTYRPKSSTTALTQAALDGATAAGAETEMIILKQRDIRYCSNCLTCYKNLEDDLAPCPLKDDMDEIVQKMAAADGILLSSPVHIGFITALMTLFFERFTWRFCRPTGQLLNMRGLPEPRTPKVRALASIVSAGGMSEAMGKKYCNNATPFMKENGCLTLNAAWIGDLYAGAEFPKKMELEDWSKAYILRELNQRQLDQARALGKKMAAAIIANRLKPFHLMGPLGPLADTITRVFFKRPCNYSSLTPRR